MLGWAAMAGAAAAQPPEPQVKADTDAGGSTFGSADDAAKAPPQGLSKPRRHGRVDQSPSSQTADTQNRPPPGLFGDWRGIRTWLGDRGVDVTARYGSESGYNVAGGDRKVWRETGQFDVSAKVDLEKAIGLNGGAFQTVLTYRRGYNLDNSAGLPVLQQVQEVYGRGQTLRLTQFWYEQSLADGLFDIKLGRTSPGEDFAAFSCHFMNLSFCGAQPGNLIGDLWQNWPIGQWGARLRVEHGDVYGQIGVYEINPRNLNKTFTIGHFGGATGVLVPVEIGMVSATRGRGLVGSYKIGAWYSNVKADDVWLDINHNPRLVTGLEPLQRNARYGLWVNLQRQLTGEAKDGKSTKGLTVFLNITQADRRTAVTDNQIAIGLFHKGLLPRVPGDVIGFAVARTNVNGKVARAELLAAPGQEPQDAEYASELYYAVHPYQWLELRPNFQYIVNPGGYHHMHDVGVLGMKAAITL
ncbi:carbohydrate porin [Sphingomonas morindae]|uniref:Carbohydrate porin n=1 Tax=Sphingomonas morindae TaxID=1541170 RepID=A0ABY4XDP4_9SPHN|nr:carbohydrate porin [Sphingomonas morindae]USI75027.1 carbohydrate porin [Sphingomonas morindae]